MKLHEPVSLILVLLAGCGGSNTKQASTDGAIAPSNALSIQSATIHPQVTELLRAAGQAEAESRFADAASLWREIRSHLVAQYGAGHWQVANCDQAIAGDERLVQLEPSERSSLELLQELERQATKHSQSGALRRALECVNQATPIAQRIFGDVAALPLRLQLMAGQLAQQMGDWDRAKREFELAATMAQQLYAPPHPDLETAYYQLGVVERQVGGIDRSIELLTQSQQMIEALVGRDATFAARTHELGIALHRAARWDDALREFESSEKIWRTVLGEGHPLVAESLVNQAVVLIDQQQGDLAKAKLVAAERIVQANPAKASLQQDIWLHLATIHVVQKDFAAAVRQLQTALESIDRRVGRLNPEYAHVAYRTAMCLSFQSNFDQAEPLFRHALEVQGNLLGASHDQTRKTLQGLAMLLQRTERPAEAQALLRRFAYTAAEASAATTQ